MRVGPVLVCLIIAEISAPAFWMSTFWTRFQFCNPLSLKQASSISAAKDSEVAFFLPCTCSAVQITRPEWGCGALEKNCSASLRHLLLEQRTLFATGDDTRTILTVTCPLGHTYSLATMKITPLLLVFSFCLSRQPLPDRLLLPVRHRPSARLRARHSSLSTARSKPAARR